MVGCTLLLNSTFSDGMLVPGNWLWWEYLFTSWKWKLAKTTYGGLFLFLSLPENWLLKSTSTPLGMIIILWLYFLKTLYLLEIHTEIRQVKYDI